MATTSMLETVKSEKRLRRNGKLEILDFANWWIVEYTKVELLRDYATPKNA